jgi:multiple sugar transport system substrate-binding protein
MEPLIAGPPFVDALTLLVESAKTNSGESLKCTPADVRRIFWEGKCGMAITWPTAAGKNIADKEGVEIGADRSKKEGFEIGFAEMPGSRKVFNMNRGKWEIYPEEESSKVTFLSIAGRLGGVSAKSSTQEAAFSMLQWLSDSQNSAQICPVSQGTTLFRKSQVAQPQIWTEKEISNSSASQYADLVAKTLDQDSLWIDFRLPGREEYLSALDEAVKLAVEGESKPADALAKAAEKWRQITEKFGKERQKSAYAHSLGLE